MNHRKLELTVAKICDLNRVSSQDAHAALLAVPNPQPNHEAARGGQYIPAVGAAAQDLCETGDLAATSAAPPGVWTWTPPWPD